MTLVTTNSTKRSVCCLTVVVLCSYLVAVYAKSNSNKKKILLWNPSQYEKCRPFDSLGSGNDIFIKNKCKYTNCYIFKNLEDRTIHNSTNYDAIMFDGRLINDYSPYQLPKLRSSQQLYIFVQLQSASDSPVCRKYYDNYFNWTITYRLDADIPWTYFKIKTLHNRTVGPSEGVNWMEPSEMLDISESLKNKLQQKSRLACFISDCHSSNNDWIVSYLNDKLARIKERQKVDILYDTCEPKVCARNESTRYHSLIKRYHYFHMAIENSVDKDFVSDKLLIGFQHDTVPIVYGGADYAKFAPPGSYIDVTGVALSKLPQHVTDILKDHTKYYDFFKWRNHYYYEKSSALNTVACELCEKLNENVTHKSYERFRFWWNKDYERTCNLFSYKDLKLNGKGKHPNAEKWQNSITSRSVQEVTKYESVNKTLQTEIFGTKEETLNGRYAIKILLWSRDPYCVGCKPFDAFKTGNTVFKENACEFTNCYIQYKRQYPAIVFDAIIFNGRPIMRMQENNLPPRRKSKQIYIFLSLESPDRFPICHDRYDNYFNWTMTYRLDSDLPWPYFKVNSVDTNNIIAPNQHGVQWIQSRDMNEIGDQLKLDLSGKTKLAVWFVSNCHGAVSGRKEFVNKLNNELVRLGVEPVDIYGQCGPMKCPKNEPQKCSGIIKDYLFYLAFENAITEDYITEKVLLGYENNAVPVVLGGANYTRFLPPGSYIDAFTLGPKQLAQKIVALSKSRNSYYQYFKWKNHYAFSTTWPICDLCSRLNKPRDEKTYKNFRYWWNKKWWFTCLEPSKVFKH